MSIERPEKEEKDESIHGKGFTMKGKPYSSSDFYPSPSVEARPGESTEKKTKETEIRYQEESERTKDFTPADWAEEHFAYMLEGKNPYSETFKIKSDGRFDKVERLDGSPVFIGEADTPEELYRIAAEIEEKHPEYHFSFETDKEGRWMKYTVSKNESAK
ncbi:MAG: hypothetical protein Q8O83_03980 [bacterium]|nr:hypothetical protein [bacterium]